MPDKSEFQATFNRLRAIFKPYARKLVVVHDTADNYYLDMPIIMKNKKPVFFGAVRKGKGYVSFHLMPVYGIPQLLEGISPELKKRMQGKSCFNFTSVDEKLFKELTALTKTGFAKFMSKEMLARLASYG